MICSHGLPTCSRVVSEFMIGLEKTKAKAGEVSQSARALSLEDMHRLYKICFDPNATDAQKRWGAIRYVSPSRSQNTAADFHHSWHTYLHS